MQHRRKGGKALRTRDLNRRPAQPRSCSAKARVPCFFGTVLLRSDSTYDAGSRVRMSRCRFRAFKSRRCMGYSLARTCGMPNLREPGSKWNALGFQHMPKITSCEVRTAGGWRIMDIEEALGNRQKDGRCPQCHELVRPHKTGTTGQAAHFEHRKHNPRCPLSS